MKNHALRCLSFLAAALLVLSCAGCIRTGRLEPTVENIAEANRITVLTRKYGTVSVHASSGGEFVDTDFFRYDGTVAKIEVRGSGDAVESRSGSYGDLIFDFLEDGSVHAQAAVAGFAGDPPDVDLTDAEGETYADNAFLLYPILSGETHIAAEKRGVLSVWTSLEGTAGDTEDPVSFSEIDEKTLVIRKTEQNWNTWTTTVECGKDPDPAADVFREAMKNTRTLRYHVWLETEESEYEFEVPADWSFSLEVWGDITFYSDAGQTKVIDNYVPADGEDREIWVSDAKG